MSRVSMENVPKAEMVKLELCDCGCNGILLQLLAADHSIIAFGSLAPDDALGIAADLETKATRIALQDVDVPRATHPGGRA
jgi:hypothetical protein